MSYSIKARVLFRNLLNNVLGISAEIAAALVFILLGFVVSVFWWGVIR